MNPVSILFLSRSFALTHFFHSTDEELASDDGHEADNSECEVGGIVPKGDRRIKARRGYDHGHPVGVDQTGRRLFRRPSDGKVVYLYCLVDGCTKTGFKTLYGLVIHIRGSKRNQHAHGLKGCFKNRNELIDACSSAAFDDQ